MTTAIAIVVGVLVIVNLVTNAALLRSPRYGIGEKITQSLLIWMVPLFGAFAAWVILREASYEPERHRDYGAPIAGGDYSHSASFGSDGGGDGGGDGGE